MNEAVHAADEPDEATRILQAGAAPAPVGDIQAMRAALTADSEDERTTILSGGDPDAEERTTILVHGSAEEEGTPRPVSAEAAPPATTLEPPEAAGQAFAALPGEADDVEPLTPEHSGALAVLAQTEPLPDQDLPAQHDQATETWDMSPDRPAPDAALPAWPEDPVTASAEQVGEPSWPDDISQAASQADIAEEATTLFISTDAPDDERTTILHADTPDDERTSILRHDGPAGSQAMPPSDASALLTENTPEAAAPAPEPDIGEAAAWPADRPDAEEATSILQAVAPPPATPDSTEILPAALSGLPDGATGEDGQVSSRAWFDRRLRDFNHALLHTQTGQKRPAAERQALAAGARDMIQRVALRDPDHKAADWVDTVLQPDQLLVNTYFVRALIARGGVGEIYRARHRDLKTEHAIKILLPRYALDPTVLNLMLEEARLLQRVRHEAVVGCQGLLRDTDGRPMLVMDYLRGRTLSARLREGALSPPDMLVLAARLAAGLSAVHAQGLVHQDISPDNIILVDDNCAAATIIDFGLARSLDAPENTHRNIDFAGKFSWCSPEQLASRATQIDARSDLYSLGLVLAAAARGTRLDMGRDLASARAARHAVPPLTGMDEPIATLLRHLLAPSTAMRLRSAEEVPEWLRPRRPGFLQRWLGR